ncbi:flagellar protein FlaG [Brevibacillus sp. HB1.2]|uniref:flagellar protein FlaG n=1 Tax=Brevibacillus sp. HB1.2 TaxID=2738807 RepID=UPI0015750C7F|nr:flagellar protein FlaG [Brevibacillus sp. HB1.2]NTU21787.1 flagellar protein FlaG [Brevibacillus sp. HB1.2]
MDIGVTSSLGRTSAKTDGGQAQAEASVKSMRQSEVAGEKAVSKEELSKEIDGINKWLQTTNTHVKFTLHEKLNEYYVQVINDQTQEVIREIPSKKMMDMVAKIHEMVGLLVDEKR